MQYRLFLLLLPFILLHCESNENRSPSSVDVEDTAQRAPSTKDSVASMSNVPPESRPRSSNSRVVIGAERLLESQLADFQGKRVALVANHTTLLPDGSHLVDVLLAQGVNLVSVFAPEHGFRGDADAGQRVRSSTDPKTGLPLISLYGSNKKPTPAQLAKIDAVIFDIQDVGARFYTYISTMAYVMEACAESGVPIWILDRPNPNGWYVDGPVLDQRYESFIGMHPIPIVHGMTVGEYASMVNTEGWLKDGVQADLHIIRCEGYTHEMRWDETGLPWVSPSPNLASEYAAYLYPALCWFEPTPVSIGRGTDSAFTLVGAAWLRTPATARVDEGGSFELYGHALFPILFTPRSLPGKSTSPKYQDQEIPGYRLQGRSSGKALMLTGISLFLQLYQSAPEAEKKGFFKQNFERWPGISRFRTQIESQENAEAIYNSWQEDVAAFRKIRAKYLLYQ